MNQKESEPILSSFCAPDHPDTRLHAPSEHNGYTYETDGHKLVLIKGSFGFTRNEGPDVTVVPLKKLDRHQKKQ